LARLDRLRVRGLRNLEAVDLDLGSGLVWLQGGNGAGKTSVLEAVYLLSRGTTFRGRRFGPLTTRGQPGTRLDGWMRGGDRAWQRSWRLDAGGREIAGDGFEVRLVGSSMQSLIEGEPDLRRRFVDWNLFHVEPRFEDVRSRFRRVAAQRAAWLRAGGQGAAVWDRPYLEGLTEVAAMRSAFSDSLATEFASVAGELDATAGLELQFKDGLPIAGSAAEQLERQRVSDIARGYTFLSPARADFGFRRGDTEWRGSRGENKVAAILLQVAAERVVARRLGRRAVWLVDDLAAELDTAMERRTLELILDGADQVLAASLGSPPEWVAARQPVARFHVEHGSVSMA